MHAVIADGITFSGPAFDGAAKTASHLSGVNPKSPAVKQALTTCGGGTRRLG
jgi:hypothetical protein